MYTKDNYLHERQVNLYERKMLTRKRRIDMNNVYLRERQIFM